MTKLQNDIQKMYGEAKDGSWQRVTLHNARLKLSCLEQLLSMHDAMGDALELAHEIDEEQDLLESE